MIVKVRVTKKRAVECVAAAIAQDYYSYEGFRHRSDVERCVREVLLGNLNDWHQVTPDASLMRAARLIVKRWS